jgi:hypothetical protein
MPTLLRLDNFAPANIREVGRVSFDAAAAQATARIDGADALIVGSVVYIGRRGTPSTERAQVQTIVGDLVTFTANFVLEHRRYQPVVLVRGDQAKIYRAANVDGTQPADADFTVIATIALDADQQTTDYQDDAGSADYWYKYTFYNSVSLEETDKSQSTASRGGSYGHYAALSDIRAKAGFANNLNITDATINTARLAAEGEINSTLAGLYTLPFSDPVPVSINTICKLLAAGTLLNDEYGPMSVSGGGGRGDKAFTEARAMLKAIKEQNATVQDELLQSLLISTAQLMSSWPNATTETAQVEDGGSTRKFRMDRIF